MDGKTCCRNEQTVNRRKVADLDPITHGDADNERNAAGQPDDASEIVRLWLDGRTQGRSFFATGGT
jgi:hypothetical protein